MVYVDSAKAPLGRMLMCHMMATAEEELHAMAAAVGLKRKWFQGDHYDLCQTKRAAAVRLGAHEVSSQFLVELRRQRRQP